jgi:hypothetical protein
MGRLLHRGSSMSHCQQLIKYATQTNPPCTKVMGRYWVDRPGSQASCKARGSQGQSGVSGELSLGLLGRGASGKNG